MEDLQFRVEEACITKGDLEVFEFVCADIIFRPTAVVTLDFDPFTEFKWQDAWPIEVLNTTDWPLTQTSKLQVCSAVRKQSRWNIFHIFNVIHVCYLHAACLKQKAGVSNPAPGELLLCRIQLQLQSNTPEPDNQGVQDYFIITGRCWSRGGDEVCRMGALLQQVWRSLL